ncbi:hypothetical protein PG990_009232 [Apiospora arundinis]
MSCLNIPTPGCIHNHVREPPICYPSGADHRALELIEEFGKEFKRPEAEIKKACELASGLSDLIVILERPHSSQIYSQDFAEFVQACRTLKAVDELIRVGRFLVLAGQDWSDPHLTLPRACSEYHRTEEAESRALLLVKQI